MKFIPLRDLDIVTSSLNFDTLDCRVTGACDLYTTKAAGSDKKLYKEIDQSLESQHAALLKFGASLSPPQREELAASKAMTRSSPFGNLADTSSRRTFAYLIATLNASHPDYDFSHVLRPADFRRERDLRKVMSAVDSTLSNLRPIVIDGTVGSVDGGASVGSSTSPSDSTSPAWGPQMWALLNKEMHLQECTVFSYQPENNIIDEEEGAIWAMHYFFFSKPLKRVAYMYVRGVPLMAHSPQLQARQRLGSAHYGRGSSIAIAGARGRIAKRRKSSGAGAGDSISRSLGLVPLSLSAGTGTLKRSSFAVQDAAPSLSMSMSMSKSLARPRPLHLGTSGTDASKRAQYWLGEAYADRVVSPGPGDVEDDDENMDEMLMWQPDDVSDDDVYGGENGGFADDDDVDFDDDDDDVSILDSDDGLRDAAGDAADTAAHKAARAQRGMSEEIAGRMEIE